MNMVANFAEAPCRAEVDGTNEAGLVGMSGNGAGRGGMGWGGVGGMRCDKVEWDGMRCDALRCAVM
mgnify:CR=1 FL=1